MNILVNDIKIDPVTFCPMIRFEGSIPLEPLQDALEGNDEAFALIGRSFIEAIRTSMSITEEELE